MVILAVPTFGKGGLNELLNPRFGRCDSFTFVTIEKGNIKEVRTVSNAASGAMGGAGIQAAQIIGSNGAEELIAGFLGPNAARSLSALNIKIFQAPNQQMTVKQCIELYLQGKLIELDNANVDAHYGMGAGMGGGRGMGRGGGRGMGRRDQF
jgi:predicted Fe-Mo cluster-binding NifX family protein